MPEHRARIVQIMRGEDQSDLLRGQPLKPGLEALASLSGKPRRIEGKSGVEPFVAGRKHSLRVFLARLQVVGRPEEAFDRRDQLRLWVGFSERRIEELDRKSTRLNSSHVRIS